MTAIYLASMDVRKPDGTLDVWTAYGRLSYGATSALALAFAESLRIGREPRRDAMRRWAERYGYREPPVSASALVAALDEIYGIQVVRMTAGAAYRNGEPTENSSR